MVGASELIEEVSTGKITGEEDRYSHTDLWDFAANVEGSEYGVELLTPALEEADPELLADIQANFEELDAQLSEYEDGEGGYVSYEELTDEDKTAMTATLAELSENLSLMAGALGLQMSPESPVSRRTFLQGTGGAALVGGATGLFAACCGRRRHGRAEPTSTSEHRYLDFRGAHQPGVTALHQASSLVAAFHVTAADRDELREMFEALTDESERLMTGTPYEERDPAYPALYTGHLGNPPPPADLSVIISVGASLFDDRYGLADRKPATSSRCRSWPTTASTRSGPTATCSSRSAAPTRTPTSSPCASSCG